jgi:hypothetical protein
LCAELLAEDFAGTGLGRDHNLPFSYVGVGWPPFRAQLAAFACCYGAAFGRSAAHGFLLYCASSHDNCALVWLSCHIYSILHYQRWVLHAYVLAFL